LTTDQEAGGSSPPGRIPLKPCLIAAALILPFPLVAQDPVTLDTVRVTAVSRIPSSLVTPFRSVQVIDRARLERLPALTVADVLATSPGVDVRARSPAQADVALRGSTYGQVLILVDGVRVSDAQTGHFNLDLAVPLDMIERIEILEGPGSAIHGADAIGGVINVVTRRVGPAWNARVWTGSFGGLGAAAEVGTALGRLRLRGGADFARSSGHRPGTDFEIAQSRLAAEFPVAGGRAVADVATGARDFGAADFYAPFPSEERTRSTTATLHYESRADLPWSVTARAATRRHSDLFTLTRDDPAPYQNRHISWQTSGEVLARYGASSASALAVGAEATDLRLASERLGDRHETRGAVFTEATLGHARGGERGATLNAGVRLDRSSAYGDFLSPSAAVSLPLARALSVRGSVGRGFRAPTWTERYYEDPANIGDPDLRPERFVAGEIGVRFFPAWRLKLDVAGFTRDAKTLIDWARPVGADASTPWRTMNVASAAYRGIEAQLDAPGLFGVDWRLHAMGLHFEATGADGFVGKYALRPVTRTIGVSASAPMLGSVRMTLDGVHITREAEGSYVLANVRVTYASRGMGLTLDVFNLGSAEYLDASTKQAAGRAVYVGARWTLP
jgi:outer membrane cobalamin receptor